MTAFDIMLMVALVLAYSGSFISFTISAWATFYFAKPVVSGILQRWKHKRTSR